MYKVIKGSQTAHCCFKATVIDTTAHQLDGDVNHMIIGGEEQYEPVCETFSIEEADLICLALNNLDSTSQP